MSNGIDIQPRIPPFAPGLEALRGLASSVVSDVMGRMEGSTGLHPVNRSPVQACGNAVTVKVRAGDNLLIHRALDMLEPGDVLNTFCEAAHSPRMTLRVNAALLGFIPKGVKKSLMALTPVRRAPPRRPS